MRRLALAALALALAPLLATPRAGAAQVLSDEDWFRKPGENTTGLMVALYGGLVPGIDVTIEKSNFSFGDGMVIESIWASSIGVQAGWGFTPAWMAYLNVDRSDHNLSDDLLTSGTASLHHVEVGARYSRHYRHDRLVGYANLGVGMRQLYSKRFRDPSGSSSTGTIRATLTGREVAGGVGAQWFFTRRFAADGNLQLGFGDFGRMSVTGQGKRDIKSDTSPSARLRVGIAWYPTFDR